ncbi:MAG: SDR family NAD(P)-dependent oxidoreductase, partial [Lachnospiraceae bacterium]|nr:SDR family NAD(P)-dependent oxidoreductase [Lachnospiraceae bacterium]
MYNQKLNGMTAVITGGNGVIGGVFARALAGEGADIAIICRNTGSAEGVMKDIRELGREAAVFQGDVLSREDMLRCREEILTRFGHINMLVNCAGG